MNDSNAPPRQTLGYLRNLLGNHGILPKNKLGQNFLIDLNLLDLLVRSAELTPDDLVLEVGSGTGTLTGRLLAESKAVVTVEIDASFQRLVREQVGDPPNMKLVPYDVLKSKNAIQPLVFEAIHEMQQKFEPARLKLVANLPYAVATPVIANLLLTDLPVERMVVMVQWEIAERLTAKPATEQYAALAVLMASLADVEIVRRVPPSAFWPRPQVDSAIVLVKPNAEKRKAVGDVLAFRAFLRDLYVHRRKNLRQSLSGWPTGRKDKAAVDEVLAGLGIDGTRRAEELDAEQHQRLARAYAGMEVRLNHSPNQG